MSRRQRTAKHDVARARFARAKALRRRARAAGPARAATAVTAAAVTFAGAAAAWSGSEDAVADPVPTASVSAPCPSPAAPSSTPRQYAALGDTMFFTADDGVHGRELWKTDGTEAGTLLVKNIKTNDSTRRAGSSPRGLTTVGGMLFFSAGDGTRGRELWKSDGTRAGTVLVKDIHPRSSGDPRELTPWRGGFAFTADDGTHGRELWKSDGTRAGTVLVQDVAPPRTEPYAGSPHYLTALGKRVFFAADDGPHGVELWRSNGTRSGTVMVKDIDTNRRNDDPDYPGSTPIWLTAARESIFFVAGDESHGEELWKSDGSRVGTVMVKDISDRDRRSRPPHYLTPFAGQLLFTANDGVRGNELWRSDGTRAGTVMVKDIDPSNTGSGWTSRSNPRFPTVAADRLFFVADDGTTGEGLWRSDGSRAGTALVKNVDLSGESGYADPLAAAQDQVFFSAEAGTPGQGLWTSDGTFEGTVLLRDFDSCGGSLYGDESRPSHLTALDNRLFFAAEDAAHGVELWTSDGTEEGTVLVKDIRTGPAPRDPG